MRYTVTPLLARLMLLRKLFGPAPTPEQFEAFPRALVLAPRALRASTEESAMMIPSVASLKDRYVELKLPVLIETEAGGRIVDHEHQSLRLIKLLTNNRMLVLPGVGHMVHHIEPRRIAAAMSETAPLLQDVA